MDYKKIIDEDLIEKVYLYCYKKLQIKADAEDLAQDIMVETLTELHKGKEIHAFYSWFWTLAHNRYCVFLSKKNKTPYTISIEGGQIAGSLYTEVSLDDELIMREEICELNYAISRLSEQHRKMVIMFYLKEMKVSEIARALEIPEGTVKRRLFDMKNNLKKGFETMNSKNTGKSAYAPASLNKWGGFGAPKYWARLNDLILDQIFIACRAEAKTINEIADEIGVAPVYLESIMAYPLEHKFLKKDAKGKYLTDICIIPAQANCDANYQAGEIYANLGAEMTEILEKKKDTILSFDFYGNKFDYNYLLWILYVFACSRFSDMALEKNEQKWEGKIPKDNGKDYRFAGSFALPDEKIDMKPLKQVGWSNLHDGFENEKYGIITYANLFHAEPFSDRDGLINASNDTLLFKLIESGGNIELNEIEKEQAAYFTSKGVIIKDGGKLKVNIPVMTAECVGKIHCCLEDLLQPLVDKYVDDINAMADKILRPLIRDDLLEEYAHWILAMFFYPIGRIFHYAMYECGTLAIPADYAQSAAGLYLQTR